MQVKINFNTIQEHQPESVKNYLEKITKRLYFTFQNDLRGTYEETDFDPDMYIKTHQARNSHMIHKAQLTTFSGTRSNSYFAICAVLAAKINTDDNKNVLEFGVDANPDEHVATYIQVKDNTDGFLAIRELYNWMEKIDFDSVEISL